MRKLETDPWAKDPIVPLYDLRQLWRPCNIRTNTIMKLK